MRTKISGVVNTQMAPDSSAGEADRACRRKSISNYVCMSRRKYVALIKTPKDALEYLAQEAAVRTEKKKREALTLFCNYRASKKTVTAEEVKPGNAINAGKHLS